MTSIQKPREFIIGNMRLLPAPSVPEIQLYSAHPGSGLSRLLGEDHERAPYWAYHWAGGSVLARHIFSQPEIVACRQVLDLGCGSGIVGIAAALCGASRVMAVDIDPLAVVAAELNAAANFVAIAIECRNILSEPPPAVDLILAGDLFYDPVLAGDVLPFLRRCRAKGIEVLIGDPGRKPLPREALRLVAEYPAADFGDVRTQPDAPSGVFTLD